MRNRDFGFLFFRHGLRHQEFILNSLAMERVHGAEWNCKHLLRLRVNVPVMDEAARGTFAIEVVAILELHKSYEEGIPLREEVSRVLPRTICGSIEE